MVQGSGCSNYPGKARARPPTAHPSAPRSSPGPAGGRWAPSFPSDQRLSDLGAARCWAGHSAVPGPWGPAPCGLLHLSLAHARPASSPELKPGRGGGGGGRPGTCHTWSLSGSQPRGVNDADRGLETVPWGLIQPERAKDVFAKNGTFQLGLEG